MGGMLGGGQGKKAVEEAEAAIAEGKRMGDKVISEHLAAKRASGYRKGGVVKAKKMAKGGKVPGKGKGDTVPAMLTPGEFVMKKSMAKKNMPMLQAMNKGRMPAAGPMGGGRGVGGVHGVRYR